MLSTLVALVGGGPVLMRTTAGNAPKKVASVSNEGAYQKLGRAADLLDAGRDAEALGLLRENAGQPLEVKSGAHGDGALKEFSPTTLLMRLGRQAARRAETAAKSGDRAGALTWVGVCEDLSRQVLDSPSPTLDALNVARFLDSRADAAEVAVYKSGRETQLAAKVERRRTETNRFWHTRVLAELTRWTSRWGQTDLAVKRDLAGDPAAVEALESQRRTEESRVAVDLIRRYQLQRMQVGGGAPRNGNRTGRPLDA